MSEGIKLLTSVLGALALFIYGMGLMSDGLKETAGAKLKGALNYMTRNRLLAIVAGAAVTALIQSSSATSVMTVGFVNAGLCRYAKRSASFSARMSEPPSPDRSSR